MKIGIKGQTFGGKAVWTHFERVPGSHEPQIRITTDSEQIYIPEDGFIEMIRNLYGEPEGRHARRVNG